MFGTDVPLCVPDLGEEDERQHEDEDLPGAAAEGRVRHPSTLGRLNLDLVAAPPRLSILSGSTLFLFFTRRHDSRPLVLYGLQNRLNALHFPKQMQW